MQDGDNETDLNKQSLMGHLRLLPIMVFFGMLAYGFINLLIWLGKSLEGKF